MVIDEGIRVEEIERNEHTRYVQEIELTGRWERVR